MRRMPASATTSASPAPVLGRSLYRLLNVELGFRPDHLATVRVAGTRCALRPAWGGGSGWRSMSTRPVATLPGVHGGRAVTSVLPVSFNGNTTWVRFVGRPYHGEHNEVNQRDVSPGYLAALRGAAGRRPLLHRRR